MAYKLDEDCALSRIKSNVFEIDISSAWNITAPNGGYVCAVASQAAVAVGTQDAIISATAYFHKPTLTCASQLVTRTLGQSGRLHTIEVELWQNEVRASTFVFTLANREAITGRSHSRQGNRKEMPKATADHRPPFKFYDCVDMAIPEKQTGWVVGKTDGDTQFSGTFCFRDGRPIDSMGLIVLGDATAPPALKLTGPVGWVPTIDYNIQIRRNRVVESVNFVATTNHITEGLVETDVELYAPDGEILAISRQLAMLREG